MIFAAFSRIFVFSATGASKKLIVGENSQNRANFQEYWGGIGGDRVQSKIKFLRTASPSKRVETLSTLSLQFNTNVLILQLFY